MGCLVCAFELNFFDDGVSLNFPSRSRNIILTNDKWIRQTRAHKPPVGLQREKIIQQFITIKVRFAAQTENVGDTNWCELLFLKKQ